MTKEQADLLEIIRSHPSNYPYVYRLLNTIKKENIKVFDKDHEELIKSLQLPNNLHGKITILLKYIYSETFGYYDYNQKKLIDYGNPEDARIKYGNFEETLLKILKLFYLIEKTSKNTVMNRRDDITTRRIGDWENKTDEQIFNSIAWIHDGYANTFLKDRRPDYNNEKILDFLQGMKTIQKNNKATYHLLLAYRLYEKGKIKESIKAIKSNRFLRWNSIRNCFKELSTKRSLISRALLSIVDSYGIYARVIINNYLFLYKVTKKKRYLRKLKRVNNYFKLVRNIKLAAWLDPVKNSVDVRPQHILKIIEVSLEEKKIDKDYIQFLFLEYTRVLNYYYYTQDNAFMNYFCIIEFLFVIFLYFDKLGEINLIKELEEN